MKNKTAQIYRRIVRQCAKHAGKPAGTLTAADFEAFVAGRALAGYSAQSLNLYRAAANKYLESTGTPERLAMYSARQQYKRPQRILSRAEVADLLDGLNPFYRAIAECIYRTPAPPQTVLANTPAQSGGTVTYRTLSVQLRRVSCNWQRGPAPPYALFVSGVIHALVDGRDWRELAKTTGLAESTIKKYSRFAKSG